MPRRRQRQESASELVHSDGALAVTFANTGSRRSPLLRDYAELLLWAAEHGALAAVDAVRLSSLPSESPERAARGFDAATELHGLLHQILGARAEQREPPPRAVRGFNDLAARILPRRVLVPGESHLVLAWSDDSARDVYRPLWSVVRSATRLLTCEDYDKVRRCSGKGCDVLFLAKGRGIPRRWCSMKSCGDADRARRYYHRVTKASKKDE